MKWGRLAKTLEVFGLTMEMIFGCVKRMLGIFFL